MGLRNLFQSAAKTAFKVAGDVVIKGIYTSNIDDGINAATSKVTAISVLFGEFSVEEKAANKNYQPGDVVGLVLGNELNDKPIEGDKLVVESNEYRVVAYSHDPARAVLKLHLRTI